MEIAFRSIRIENIFDQASWAKLDRAFGVSKEINREAGRDCLSQMPRAKFLEKEVPFRKLPDRRAAVAVDIDEIGGKYRLDLVLSYNQDYVDRWCGADKFFYSPDIWEGRVENVSGPASVAAVLSGDYNRDRKTDLLVVLTTGAAYVFQQVPGLLPPTTCERDSG